jgi:hypothetical protein
MKEIEDRLSPAEIEAATREVISIYYAFYDNQGNITAVSNEIIAGHEHFIQISYEIFENFVTCREIFSNWVVNKTKNSSNELGVELVQRSLQASTFKNNMFEIIQDMPTEDTEVTVHWDGYYKCWIFLISDEARQQIYDNKIGSKVLTFYVVYEHLFDFLIRTIEIPIGNLIADKVIIPFEHAVEEKYNKINISTKSVFGSYGISIWRIIKDDEDSNN